MFSQTKKQPIVTDQLIDALESVLAYLWSEEFFDYRATAPESDPERQNHIFLKLEVVRRWLDSVEEDLAAP